MMAWVFCGCNSPSPQTATFHEEKTAGCEGLAIKSQYILKWKNGDFSVVHAKDRAHFLSEYFEPLKEKIEYAEPDYNVFLEKTLPVTPRALATNEATWGQDLIEAKSAWSMGKVFSRNTV